MAGRSPEAYQTQFRDPKIVRQDVQIDPQLNKQGDPPVLKDPNQKTNGERFARGYRAVSVGQATVYTGLGFVHPIFFAAAAFNVGEAGISHKIVKNKEKQRVQETVVFDAKKSKKQYALAG